MVSGGGGRTRERLSGSVFLVSWVVSLDVGWK